MDRIEKLKEFLRDNPADSFLQHALALEYISLGEDREARVLFETVLRNDAGYIGTYYHLAKLLERTGENEEAKRVYEKGIEMAKNAGDNHALNELRSAYEEFIY